MNMNKLTGLLFGLISLGLITACSHKSATELSSKDKNLITVDNGADVPTIDPTISQDNTSTRVLYDLFEGLTSFDQSQKTIPGLAEKWEISTDGRIYTFHLRPGIKFSDGSPITAQDVVFSWQRLVDPNIASPYSMLASNVVNANQIIAGKLPLNQLGVKALDAQTIQINLINPDSSFLKICAMPNVAIMSKANVTKFGQAWTDPKNMVTSGAYTLSEWVVQGHMLLTKNPNYYAAKSVAIEKVNILPIVDTNSAFNRYQTGEIDITYSFPVDQYKQIKKDYPDQIHTVSLEALAYYNLNMTLAKFKNNPQLRQALSMAVDRQAIVQEVLGQGQVASYSYATSTVENGKFAGLDYPWASWPRDKQITTAQELFKAAGYGPNNPLKLMINYNTNDGNKKLALAVGSMWQQVFGTGIQVTQANQEWKTFLKARNKADYDVGRDAWIADYNSVDSYTNLYQCGNLQNNAKSCNHEYDKLIAQAQASQDPEQRVKLIRQALQLVQNDYAIIPLYQYTYTRLVNPRVKGYDIDTNHLDHVMSKWYKLD